MKRNGRDRSKINKYYDPHIVSVCVCFTLFFFFGRIMKLGIYVMRRVHEIINENKPQN